MEQEEANEPSQDNSTTKKNLTAIQLTSTSPVVPLAGKVELSVSSKGAEEIVIRQFSREVARFKGSEGKLKLPAHLIGKGPVRLQAYAEPTGATSAPLWMVVE